MNGIPQYREIQEQISNLLQFAALSEMPLYHFMDIIKLKKGEQNNV